MHSKILLKLLIVKSANDLSLFEYSASSLGESDLNHCTRVLFHPLDSSFGSGTCFRAQRSFASVEVSVSLQENGLRFIGFVKTATSQLPMHFISDLQVEGRMEHHAMISSSVDIVGKRFDIMAVKYVDCNSQYFINTFGESFLRQVGMRQRWWEEDVATAQVDVPVVMPDVVEKKYSASGAIDGQNQCR